MILDCDYAIMRSLLTHRSKAKLIFCGDLVACPHEINFVRREKHSEF